ncbi:MAG: hypothetical protein QXY49_04605 [Thermofilaceae archaeon]
MPRPALRSRAVKKKLVRTPGGRLVLHIQSKKHKPPKCALCKVSLHGFPRMSSKEERRGHRPPNRMYGGYLCADCLRKALKAAVDARYHF